jgi:hypothetical protein
MRTRILLALLLTCGTARADEWLAVGKTDDGKQVLVDVSSIRLAGDIRRAWIKGVAVPHTTRGPGKYSEHWLSYFLTREAFNCAEELVRTESKEAYFDDGSSISDSPESYPTQWKPVEPESRGHAEMQFICSWKPK